MTDETKRYWVIGFDIEATNAEDMEIEKFSTMVSALGYARQQLIGGRPNRRSGHVTRGVSGGIAS